MKIASFNINSIRAHLENFLNWIDTTSPDIILLQELKCIDEQFPSFLFEERGYQIALHGQKSWNGVAILSKFSIEDVTRSLPSFPDPQARYIEAFTGGVRIASIYMPNGNPLGTEKFDYKIKWMEAFQKHLDTLKTYDEAIILGGDFNVVPTDKDAQNLNSLKENAIAHPHARELFATFTHDWMDALRHLNGDARYYTWWGYRANERTCGLLLDFFLLNPLAEKMLKTGGIDIAPRNQEKPSDHVPIWIELD